MKRAILARAARLALLLVAASPPARATAQPAVAKPPEPPRPIELALSPAPAPVPALKYRLLPNSAERVPGDAAPIYLRIHGYEDSGMEPAWQQIGKHSGEWLDLPIEKYPVDEARKFLGLWSRKLEQLEFGTRRKTCDWNYTLPEQRSVAVEILLPDAQSMRQWGRVLAMKARLEIAEKRYDDAIRTIETGLAFSQHLADGPFVINGLIGMAMSNMMIDRLVELVARPGAPNLYWALTTLPRPLMDLRDHIELERKFLEYVIPELGEAEAARPREPVEWGPYLSRMLSGMLHWARAYNPGAPEPAWVKTLPGRTVAQLRAEELPKARAYFKATRGLDDVQVAAMTDDQAVALFLVGRFRELNDEVFKTAYLPPRDALPRLAAVEKKYEAERNTPLSLALMNLQVIQSVSRARIWPDRRVAALRVIEAIRMDAAAHDGHLPESLDRITEVPVPDDPATGRPFLYRRAGDAAILRGLETDLGLLNPPPTYRITIRR